MPHSLSITRLLFVAFSVICATVAGCKSKTADADAGKLPDALYARPIYRMVEEYEIFTGTTAPEKMVVVKARATGHLKKINFKDGQIVKEGDLLFEIDHREYRTALERTKAALLQSEVRARRLEYDHRRGVDLFADRAMSREVFDQITGDLGEARAMVKVAEANKQTAEYNLAWCKVTAEITGRISRRAVDVGNIVEKETTVLTNIVSLDPMDAVFDIDERTVLRLQRNVKEGKLLLSQDQELKFKIGLADEDDFSIGGKINFVDNKIDIGTGTLRIRGAFDNTAFLAGTWPWERPANYRLPPGLFIRVQLPVSELRKAILIPEKAIGSDQGKKMVYVIGPDNVLQYRPVKLGSLQGDLRVIEEGVGIGELVVVNGLQRMKDKLKVNPKEDKK